MEDLIRILHLEDNPADAELIKLELKRKGLRCSVTLVSNEQAFDRTLRECEFDLILSDYSLPSYNGMLALKLAQQVKPHVPFVFVTGEMGEERAIESLKQGAVDYVMKDHLAKLIPALQRAIDVDKNRREQKAAQEALRVSEERYTETLKRSEEQYRMLFNTMMSGFALHEIICDDNGIPIDYRFLQVNQTFENLTGLEASEIVGRRVKEVLPDIEPHWIERYGQVTLTGKSDSFESFSASLNRYYEVTAYRPNAGQFAVIFHDITDRKRLQEAANKAHEELEIHVAERTADLKVANRALQDQSRYLEAFFQHAITPLVFLDKDFNFLRVNQAYATACRREVSEFPGHNHFEFYPHEENLRIFREVVRTKIPFITTAKPFEFPDHPEWGTTFWDWSLVPILDNQGNVDFLFFSLIDVTERERATIRLDEHRQGLESTVAERTRHLEEVNRRLEAEIVERKRIEDNLRSFARAIEHSPTSIVITDQNGIIQYVNPKFTALTGYASEEAIGRNPRILKSGYTPPNEYKEMWQALTAGNRWQGEFCNKKKNGELYWEIASMSAVKDECGVITNFVAVKEDITARKLLEGELQELARFPSENPMPVLRIGNDGIILYANGPAQSLLDEWKLVRGEKVTGAWMASIRRTLDRNADLLIEQQCGERLFSYRVVPFVESSYVNLYGVDITEQHDAENRLLELNNELERRVLERTKAARDSEKRLQDIIDGYASIILVKDLDGRYILVNNKMAELLGKSQDEIFGKTAYDFFPHDAAEVLFGNDRRVLEANAMQQMEEVVEFSDGKPHIFIANKFPLFDSGGKPYAICAVCLDITDRKEQEIELHRLKEHLERQAVELQNANKELEAFSYSVSHDLRAPLRAINGFVNILIEDTAEKLQPNDRRCLDLIRDNTLMMGRLIDEILTFSRLGKNEIVKSSVDMKELFTSIAVEHQHRDQARNVRMVIQNDMPLALGDVTLLRQVVENLLSNAFKFTRLTKGPAIEIGAQRDKHELVYFVKDNGAGFDMQYYDKLFNVFQRLHDAREYEGTGVGLAFCRRIINRHGGKMWAEGKEGTGATFFFSLPE